ncbi:unnamed protein product [marine sediment metagenome]|uniref:Uncharacterized protein n=1 Tax=marine sediment metagenome TaxID=412755 RepID=X1D3S7_9ZZZZ
MPKGFMSLEKGVAFVLSVAILLTQDIQNVKNISLSEINAVRYIMLKTYKKELNMPKGFMSLEKGMVFALGVGVGWMNILSMVV